MSSQGWPRLGLGRGLLAFHCGVLREQLAGAGRGRDESLSQLQIRTAEMFSLARECAIYGNDDFFVRSIRGPADRLKVSNQRLAQLPQVSRILVDYGSMILFVAVIGWPSQQDRGQWSVAVRRPAAAAWQLDADNDARLLTSIGRAFPDTALLMVTHRSYVPEYACRAFRLVSGKLVEEGLKTPEPRARALEGRT